MTPRHDVVAVGDCRLRTATWGSDVPDIVMLHDGLGSIGQWRNVPALIAQRTGAVVLAYDRAGHGESTPVPTGAWPADWLHRESDLLGELLTTLGADGALVVGHSDGGSIALLHAVDSPACRGVVAVAAHSFVESVCTDEITALRRAPERIVRGLARHHAHPAAVFEAWSGVWTSEAFASWDVRREIGSITAPVLVVQGDADEYATGAQLTETAAAIGPHAQLLMLPGVGHVVHHQAADELVDAVATFYDRFGSDRSTSEGT